MRLEKNCLYKVKKNDTLSSIAADYNLNPTSILIINNMSPKMIREGVVLYLPQR